jgi:hypothetical protein
MSRENILKQIEETLQQRQDQGYHDWTDCCGDDEAEYLRKRALWGRLYDQARWIDGCKNRDEIFQLVIYAVEVLEELDKGKT